MGHLTQENPGMYDKFQTIIGYLVGKNDNKESLTGINISNLFHPDEDSDVSVARNINATFLICLSGKTHPRYHEAEHYLSKMQQHPSLGEIASFFLKGLSIIPREISSICLNGSSTEKNLNELYSWIINDSSYSHHRDALEKVHSFFFPEGVLVLNRIPEMIDELRHKRTITHLQLNPNPIKNPSKEILFTSNLLLTTPADSSDIDLLPLNEPIRNKLKNVIKENQLHWYDHPIQIGVDKKSNELLYGLRELDKAVNYESHRGSIPDTTRMNCVLSVSVTHKGLHDIAKEYIEEELKSCTDIRHLNVYLFTEEDTRKLNDEILIPAAEKYFTDQDAAILHEIVGVDGEYGRHYSFLKAVAAFWKVFIDSAIKGTFKIDLDQVFPEEELVNITGSSAFEHFKTPLWGAKGIDHWGGHVELSMIAGALVNKGDIGKSLFTPDVNFPSENAQADEWIFFSSLPQALSTQAEMMTRYNDGNLDGNKQCIQRIHVTGGTNGILVDGLRRYRPFTPTFINRAEDQAYIMSVLFRRENGNLLRYAHKDGLIMRHDKEAFAGKAIESAKIGKLIGDYARILWFSYYARALPWPINQIKDTLDPFTGCFISSLPSTVVFLRLALKAASFFSDKRTEKNKEGLQFLTTGVQQLDKITICLYKEPNPLIKQYAREKEGWNLYYDILDRFEAELKIGDSFALELKKRAVKLVNNCKMSFS